MLLQKSQYMYVTIKYLLYFNYCYPVKTDRKLYKSLFISNTDYFSTRLLFASNRNRHKRLLLS
ncbi:hypothetical protein HMPREF1199_01375 [Hoylesella oralis CC98A]|nr:hypothetical protein HMPREF1199_01375 [Hoylesella oralis CC98A]